MQRRLLAVLLAVLISLPAAPAFAVTMSHLDLTSLALEAEAVVLARRTGERQAGPSFTFVAHRVEQVYAGPVHPGDLVEVSYDAMDLQPSGGWPNRDAGPPVVSDEVILFLAPAAGTYGDLGDAGPPPPWRLVASGLRILAEGLAYRFEQGPGDGPYEPIPQRADPFDVMRDPRAGAQLDRQGLVHAVQGAVARARKVRRVLAAKDTPEGRRAIVDLVGPPEDDEDAPVVASPDFSNWVDGVASDALMVLAYAGDDGALLDGVARVRGGVSFFFPPGNDVPVARFAAVAASREAPLHRRLAALTILGETPLGRVDAADVTRLRALVDDPEPEVRARAATLRMYDTPPPAGLDAAILARWPRETDARVQLALLRAADRLGVMGRLSPAFSGDEPVVWAERRRHLIEITWTNSAAHRFRIAHLIVTARAPHRPAVQVNLAEGPRPLGIWSSSDVAGTHAFLDLNLAPGRYELTARVDLEDDRKQLVSRTIPLRSMLVAAPAASPSDTEPPFPLTITAPPPAPPRRSCVCSAPGGGRAGHAELLAALLVAVLAAQRRWTRRLLPPREGEAPPGRSAAERAGG